MNGKKPTDIEITQIIKTLKKESNKNKNIEDYLQFSYQFSKDDFSITPLQKKGEIYTLIKLLEKLKPKRILEIGTAGGGTLFLLSKITSPNSLIISLDLIDGKFGGEHFPNWKIPVFQNFAEKNQEIFLIRKDSHSHEALQEIKSLLNNESFDFILIDGDHSFEGVQKDFEMYSPLLNKNGIIAFHDIIEGPKENVGGVPEFWKQIKSKNKTIEIVDNFGEICCGLGLYFTNQVNPQVYENILNLIIETQKIRITDLFHDTEKIKENIFHDPLTSLLNLFYERNDIQKAYPEVKKGDYFQLIQWAKQICVNPPKEELGAKNLLEKHLVWYNQFLTNQNKIKKEYDDLNKNKIENAKLANNLDLQQQENAKIQEMIVNLNFELSQTRKEIDKIKNSRGFRVLRFFGSKIDIISKKKSIINDIESTVSASTKTIKNEGFTTFTSLAKEKIKRKEFLLQSPSYTSSSVNLPSNNLHKFTIEKQNLEPKFSASVIIPTNSEENILAPLIQNLISQIGFKNLKIIIVNSGINSIKNLEKIPNLTVLPIKPEEFSHGKVRNLGMAESEGDYVFFISDDVLLTNDHLFYDMCEAISNDKNIAVVSARQLPRSDSDLMAIFSLYEYYQSLDLIEDRIISTDNFDSLSPIQKRQVAQVDDVCSCYRQDILSKHLFGKVKYAEDLDIGTRFIKEGLKICQLHSRGVIHSHKRPASYYLRRSFVETKVLSSLLDYPSFDFKKNKINSFQDFTGHVFSLYHSLNFCIEILEKQKSVNISQIFELLKKELPKNYSIQKNSNRSDTSLDDIFKKFSKPQDIDTNFLISDYQNSLNHFKLFLQNTYPNISGIEEDFFDTLYKLFSNIVGDRLAGFEINMAKQGLKDEGIEEIIPMLESGV